MTLAAGGRQTAGTYTITVTGMAADYSHDDGDPYGDCGGAGSFSLSVSPSSGSINRGTTGFAVVTVTATGGFDAPVTLSQTGFQVE